CTPVDVRPAMIARWIIRHASEEARLAPHPRPPRSAAPRDAPQPHAAPRGRDRPGGRGEPHRGLGREVDVDEPGRAVAPEGALRRALLPHDALVDLRPGLDLLARIDPDDRGGARLGPDRHLVADPDALVDADVVPDVAGAADDRTLDDGAPPEVRA